ncbi:cilia- and flagella-associated protein 157-like [Centruroides sculpturatus]|uniref:cilia- and flagella-associated protein 157-like n=1 Tax=Centruroides sculpturatus TaxID=218467 RepID=UPI000C6CBAEF|nr:cilia- and flagella-associated protein 157-like [Centruroides sculpturatus]
MPPKKEKKKKIAIIAQPFGMTYEEKECFEISVSSLKHQIDRRKSFIKEIDESSKDFQKEFEKEKQDKDDTISFLNLTVEEGKERIKQLREELFNRTKQHAWDKEELKNSSIDAKEKLQIKLDALKIENNALNEELRTLQEFEENRFKIEEEIKFLKESINEDSAKFIKEKENLERQTMLENDKLKSDVFKKVEEVGEKFRSIYNQRTAENILLALRENLRMDMERKELEVKLTQTKNEISELKNTKNQLCESLNTYSETADKEGFRYRLQLIAWKRLKEKCRIQDEKLKQMSECQKEHSNMVDTVKKLKENTANGERKLSYLIKEEENLIQRKDKIREELNKVENERIGLVSVIKDVVESSKQGTNYVQDTEEDIIEYLGKRQIMLKQQKEILETATKLTNINDFDELIWMQHQVNMPYPKSFEVDKAPLMQSLGDLGFVP